MTIKLDSFDIYLDEFGKSVWLDDFAEYSTQRLKSSLATYLNEWFYDSTVGIPYFQQIFTRNKTRNIKKIVDSIFKQHIESRTYVKKVVSFSSKFSNRTRQYEYSFVAQLTNGETISVQNTLEV